MICCSSSWNLSRFFGVFAVRAIPGRFPLQFGQPSLEIAQVQFGNTSLCLEQLDASVAMHDDLFHGQVGRQQRLVGAQLQFLLHLELPGLLFGNELLFRLAALEMLDRDCVLVQYLLRQVRVLRRNAVAVMHLAVLVDPAIHTVVLGGERGDRHCRDEEDCGYCGFKHAPKYAMKGFSELRHSSLFRA